MSLASQVNGSLEVQVGSWVEMSKVHHTKVVGSWLISGNRTKIPKFSWFLFSPHFTWHMGFPDLYIGWWQHTIPFGTDWVAPPNPILWSWCSGRCILFQGCRFIPDTCSETKPQMVPTDLNIGFQGLALISGPNLQPCFSIQLVLFHWTMERWEKETARIGTPPMCWKPPPKKSLQKFGMKRSDVIEQSHSLGSRL